MKFDAGSVYIILAVVIFFHVLSAVFCLKQRSSKALFTNSKLIIISSIFFNISEIILSLFQAQCRASLLHCSDTLQLYISIIMIFIGNCFYMTIFLRAHRLHLLSSLESGQFTLHSLDRLKSQLSEFWYLLIIPGGGFILSSPFCSYLIYKFNTDSSILSNLNIYELFVGATVSFECILLVFILCPLIKRNIPVILKVELAFQLLAWSGALFILKNSIEQRLFFLIPIRNSIMMMLILVSLYEVNKNFKPPLPPDVDLELVLESEELYQAFQRFLERTQFVEDLELLSVLLKIRIFRETSGSFDGRVLMRSIKGAKRVGHLLKEVMVEGREDGYGETEEFCYRKLEDGAFKVFKVSEEFIEILSEY